MNTDFNFSYTFDAPKKLVFEAFGNAEALNAWWGPAETQNTVISLDFKPGGIFHFRMEGGGHTSYGRFVFGAILPYDLLEFTNAFADEHGRVIPAPFDITIPKEIFYRLHFSEQDGQTTITMTGQPVNANAAEEAGFRDINGSMQEGFGKTFDQLSVYLGRAAR